MSKYNLVKAVCAIFIKANLAIGYFLRVVCIQETTKKDVEECSVIYYFLTVVIFLTVMLF